MKLSNEDYARKRIYNGLSVQIENSTTPDNCQTVTLETVTLWQNFHSPPHNHYLVLTKFITVS